MKSYEEVRSSILKRNVAISVILSTLAIVLMVLWTTYFVKKDSVKRFESIDSSFQRLLSALAESLINDPYLDNIIASNLALADQILQSENSSNVSQQTMEHLKSIYNNNLSDRYIDINVILLDTNGNIVAASGIYDKLSRLSFNPLVSNTIEDTFPKFLSFVPEARMLSIYSWKRYNDKIITFAFHISPKYYIDFIQSFVEKRMGIVEIYINEDTRLDVNEKIYDNVIASGFQSEKIINKGLTVTFYKRYTLHSYESLKTQLILKFQLHYANLLYLTTAFIALFIITVFTFTYISTNSAIQPFENDLKKLNLAVNEIGNKGILPPAGNFLLQESQQFYETLSAVLQELSATMEELEATNQDLERAYGDIETKSKQFRSLLLGISEKLAIIAEGYDENTGQHIYRVKLLSGFLAEKMGLDEEKVEEIKMFASLHDIGKIFVPKEILLKPGPLSQSEWEIMRQHTVFAKKILDVPGFETALNIALYHHENYDGTGYPFLLKGNEIPIEAHIVKLVDVYDALRSSRPYKKGFSHEETVKIIVKGDGRTSPSHFYPKLLEVFEEYQDEIDELWRSIK